MLDRIQVPASQGWLGWRGLEGPRRASQGLLGGPDTLDPGIWDPDPGTLGPLDPGIWDPGSRIPARDTGRESPDPGQFCQKGRLGPPESSVFPETARKCGKQLFSMAGKTRPASARAELKSSLLTTWDIRQKPDF